MPELVLTSFAGGLNDSDPPISLADDQCTVARNVEWYISSLGERRRGALTIDVSGSDLASCDRIVWGHRHLPTTDPEDAQCWALGITDGTPSTATLAYKDTTWHTVAMSDALTIDGWSEYQVRGVTLHGKLFLAYPSAVDRLHVWDGTSLRRVGLAQPNAPTATDTGSGSFASTRYYRVRETVQDSGTTILRSEPSDTLTFNPSGSGSGASVTRATAVNSNATHWELEASLDEANWYVIETTAIGTASVTDTAAAATGYADDGPLSEDIGDYEPPHSARFLVADEDRLVLLGSFVDSTKASSVSWTPVYNATGVGNDERITLDPVSVLNLDGFEGGAITDHGRWAPGEIAVFKEAHVYKLIRTGNRQRAYEAFTESKVVGAITGSVVEATDAAGTAALYFLDPATGPCRFTARGGLQYCGADVRTTWSAVHLDAAIVARSYYHRTKRQVRWFVATDDATVPDTGLVLHTRAMQTTEEGEARRGFATWTGPSCGVLAAWQFADNIDDDTDRSQQLVPFIGVEGGIWRTDTGDDDNGTDYLAALRSKPFTPTQLQRDTEVRGARVVAKAVENAALTLALVRNGDADPLVTSETVDCTPTADEAFIISRLDGLGAAELTTVQVEVADLSSPGARWELARVSLQLTGGQGT